MQTDFIAKALVLDEEGSVLVLRRSQTHPTMALQRDLPGGQIEPREEPGATLVRELKEETGLTATREAIVPLFAGARVYESTNRVRILYKVQLKARRPEVTISWEHAEAIWLSPDEFFAIKDEFQGFYRDALVYIRKHRLLGWH